MTRLSRRHFLAYSAAAAGSSLLLKACSTGSNGSDTHGSDTHGSDTHGSGSNTASNLGQPSASVPATPAASSDTGDIKVGLLHSLSGALAISEGPIADAEKLAIQEINEAGGLLGRQLVPVLEDGASDWPTFAEKAEKLTTQHQAAVLFGGFTTASRKAILPVVIAKNKLLWYPGPYEGQECSSHIFYAGPVANQQIEPAVNWMLGNRGKSFFLVSNNERTTHDIVRKVLKAKGGKVAGEAFVPLANGKIPDLTPVVNDIKQALPEGGIIFNSLVGSYNRTFFKELKSAGLSAYQYLVMSVRIGEEDVLQIGKHFLQGHYATWRYFQTLETPQNETWVTKFKGTYGIDRVISDPMESAYTMVHLWAQSVRQANSLATSAVRKAAYGQTFQAPSGTVTIQPNHHLTKPVHIGKIRDDGLFDILWTAKTDIAPNPWSQRLEASRGYICNWQDSEKGEKYLVTS
ncbi:MAG: transporter substrate-binding protein [Cyanobacteria bacterium J06607_13]